MGDKLKILTVGTPSAVYEDNNAKYNNKMIDGDRDAPRYDGNGACIESQLIQCRLFLFPSKK